MFWHVANDLVNPHVQPNDTIVRDGHRRRDMSVEHTRQETERTSDSRPTTYLHGRWLLLARLAWIGFALTALILFALNIVPRTHQLTRTSGEIWRLVFRQLGEGEQATLARNGLSAHVYAWYVTGCEVLAVVVCAVVGLFIFVRSSRDWMAMLGSLTVMLLGICNNTYLSTLSIFMQRSIRYRRGHGAPNSELEFTTVQKRGTGELM